LEEYVPRRHPNLMTIHHVGTTEDYLYYVMDLADNLNSTSPDAKATPDARYVPATLKSRLETGPLPPEECLHRVRQLLAGLASLHEAGMVHRDVKPANCLFEDGELKLADFGLLTEASSEISRVGTQKYMPPDGATGMQADVYSAGLVIYEMITGLPAESFPRLGERAEEVVKDPILRRLNQLALGACQRDRRQRYANAGEMLAELVQARPRSNAMSAPMRWSLAGAAAIAILAAALIGIWMQTGPTQTVEVNFITEPPNATVLLDDLLLEMPGGTPYRTPCTIPDVPQRASHVVFKRKGLDDFDAGAIDFTDVREVEVTLTSNP
jgi:serine/threonine protein kinase